MSDNRQENSADKSEPFSDLSTEELEELIGDAFFEDPIDIDLLDELHKAYDKREGVPKVDVDAAWQTFQRDYLGQGEIYLTEDADNPEQTIRPGRGRPVRRRKRLLRIGITAVVIVILASVLFTSTAFGAYAWQSIVSWTRETFGFTERPKISAGLVALQDALDEHGVTDLLVPTWLPNGYSLSNLTVNDDPGLKSFIAFFQNGGKDLTIQITLSQDNSDVTFERSDSPVTTYIRNDIEHYIMKNDDQVSAVWENDNYICTISGDITSNDAIKMIDSIYER